MRTLLIGLLAAGLLTGCAATLREAGTQEVTWTSKSRPDWVSNGAPYFRKDGKYFFVGVSTDVSNQQNARLHAKANAIRTMTEGIRLLTTSWLTDAVHGADNATMGSFLKAGVAAVSGIVDAQGLMPDSEYLEKVRTWNGTEWTHAWNVYGLYSLPEAEFTAAKKRAIEGILAKARRSNDRKAEEAAEQALRRVDAYAMPPEEVSDGTQSLSVLP